LSSEAIALRVREAISRVTSQPIRFVISSAFHNRFTRGNAVYADVLKIGHENYRTDLLKLLADESAELREIKFPQLTHRERLTLYLGGKKIQILHLGRAHTRALPSYLRPDRIAYLQ
jgi:cyclase